MTTFLSFQIPADGYGHASCQIAAELRRLSDWRIADMALPDGTHGKLDGQRSWTFEDTVVALCTPDWLPYIHAPRIISFTMFESTRLPTGWVDLLNTYASEVIVPCSWNADVFRGNGVMPKISVCKLGVSADEYAYVERNHNGAPYTFLWSGTGDYRKGWDVAYKAFWQAFQGDERARLILQFRQMPQSVQGVEDRNVEIINQGIQHTVAELNAILERADCYVYPSRGEGWGLPPREAAATGLPVITTHWSGLAENIEHWAMPVKVRGLSKADYGYWQCDLGEWAEPNGEQVAHWMHWCFENRTSAAYFGKQAAMWLAHYATWEHTAQSLLKIASW